MEPSTRRGGSNVPVPHCCLTSRLSLSGCSRSSPYVVIHIGVGWMALFLVSQGTFLWLPPDHDWKPCMFRMDSLICLAVGADRGPRHRSLFLMASLLEARLTSLHGCVSGQSSKRTSPKIQMLIEPLICVVFANVRLAK